MANLKKWLKAKLSTALEIPQIRAAVEKLGLQNSNSTTLATLYGMQYWYEGNLWEPPVQLALRDLCKPGKIVFDVGANFGGLTTVMSRMVGPRGVVCAFEASPRIVDKCQRNIIFNGCTNVQVYHVAVYHNSHQTIPIYCGSHLNDSIYASNVTDTAAFQVSTLALDDFIDFTGLVPDLLKMDIEGAEFDALKGMLKTLDNTRPHLILEQQPDDSRCLDLLREKGYIAIDLNSYREVKSCEDYPKSVAIRNNLYIHQHRLAEVPYKLPFTLMEWASLTKDDFAVAKDGSICLRNPLALEQGRYLIDINFDAEGTNNEMMCGVKIKEQVIFRYHAYTKLLAQSYRDWVIHLTEQSKIQIYFDFLNNTYDATFSVNGAKLFRVKDFDLSSSQLYI
jgi:FkbM family methyltransferase